MRSRNLYLFASAVVARRIESWSIGVEANRETRAALHLADRESDPTSESSFVNDAIFESISDAEALLACRSYLQKKNRLGGWTSGEERKAKRKMQAENAKQGTSGFFWDDPNELKYYDPSRASREEEFFESDGVQENFDMMFSGEIDSSPLVSDSRYGRASTETDVSASSSFDDVIPSDTFVKRSRAAKDRFGDPEWKKSWYEARWGTKKQSPETRKAKSLKARMNTEQMDNFLSHPELAEMSEDEIVEAIQMYVGSNKKRSDTVREARQQQETVVNGPLLQKGIAIKSRLLPRDTLYKEDVEIVDDLRQQRSERARKAYETRLKKQQRKGKPKIRMNLSMVSQEETPEKALERIEAALDEVETVRVSVEMRAKMKRDIELVLKPERLAKRKSLLLRVLNELFDLRGKCIPYHVNGKERFGFATKCTISELGDFILTQVDDSIE